MEWGRPRPDWGVSATAVTGFPRSDKPMINATRRQDLRRVGGAVPTISETKTGRRNECPVAGRMLFWRGGSGASRRLSGSLRQDVVHAVAAASARGEVEEDEGVERRQLAPVLDWPEAVGRVADEVGERHQPGEEERHRAREDADDEERGHEGLQDAGEPGARQHLGGVARLAAV